MAQKRIADQATIRTNPCATSARRKGELPVRAMNKEDQIRWYAAREIDRPDHANEVITISQITTTEREDMHETIFMTRGLDLSDYRQNPTILWAHGEEAQGTLPIGRSLAEAVVEIQAKGRTYRALRQVIEFVPKEINPFGHMIGMMAESDFIRGASIGARPTEYEIREVEAERLIVIFTRAILHESSMVAVGSNLSALKERMIDVLSVEGISGQEMQDSIEKNTDTGIIESATQVESGVIELDVNSLARQLINDPEFMTRLIKNG